MVNNWAAVLQLLFVQLRPQASETIRLDSQMSEEFNNLRETSQNKSLAFQILTQYSCSLHPATVMFFRNVGVSITSFYCRNI